MSVPSTESLESEVFFFVRNTIFTNDPSQEIITI